MRPIIGGEDAPCRPEMEKHGGGRDELRRTKLAVHEAFWMGLLGAIDGGGRGLSVGTNGASIGVVNRRESKRKGS